MKILILTIGSRGDVQPYIALGRELVAAGHAVTLCTAKRFGAFVSQNALPFAPVSDDLMELVDSVQGRGALEDMGSFVSGLRTALKLLRRVDRIQRALVEEAWRVARAVAPDLLIASPKMAGAHYADLLRIPVVTAAVFPQFVPTAQFPSLGFPRWKLGGAYNRLTYELVLSAGRRLGRRYAGPWRNAHGLAPQPRHIDVLHRTDGTRMPVLHGLSSHVVPQPSDWPEGVVNTGFWFLKRSDGWEAPPELERFLNSGPAPVYFGFGSMTGRDPTKRTRIVLEALARTGQRGVLATGWGGLVHAGVPEHVHVLEQVPHDWLFPRVAAVVHHGGAGTTAEGLRAGRPTVICPYFGDQPFWGQRVHELGAGPAPIPQKRLTAERLAAAIHAAVTDIGMRQRAEALGEKIRGENGTKSAVAFIERMFH